MNIITVIPISRSKIALELSYFTLKDIPIGAIVSVPLRSKLISGIVTSVSTVENQKTDIKNATFTIRKLNKIKATAFFPQSFIKACTLLAEYYATTIGSIVYSLIHDSILEDINKIVPPLPPQADLKLDKIKKSKSIAVQGDDTDRISSWRSLIREEFARKKSIAIYVPTIEDCERMYLLLEKGIEGYILKLNSSLSKKKIIETWNKIAEIEHPIIVIATASFSVLPRSDIDLVIIERENGRGWIEQRSPYMDMRVAVEKISHENGQTVYLADSILSTQTLYRLEKNELDEGTPLKWRSVSTAKDIIVDMRSVIPSTYTDKVEQKEEENVILASGKVTSATPNNSRKNGYRIISEQLESLIRTNREENTHIFILAIRRGLSPTTICSDCEAIVSCSHCLAPVVLHTSQKTGLNFFMCHSCGERRSADEVCSFCGSWRLTPLGIGIDKVMEEIKNRFPSIDIFKIDADSTKNEKQIKDTILKFKAKPGSVLLGTEMAMQYLIDKLEYVAIASLDTLFALPDFRIEEKIMHALIRLRASTERVFLIQTRQPDKKVFEYGLKGNLSDFYKASIHERKKYSYPPFTILIKISIEGKKDEISKSMIQIEKLISPYTIDIFPAFTSTVRGQSIIHGLIKVVSHAWPDPNLIEKLRTLPPNIIVKINPESLL